MKLIIHGGFFSESSTSLETKVAKQEALEQIVRFLWLFKNTFSVRDGCFAVSLLEELFLMQELGHRYKVMEKSGWVLL
jgi:L-asparaginase